MIYIQMDGSDYTVEDIISEEYLHVITDKKDEVLKLKNKYFWSIEITVLSLTDWLTDWTFIYVSR